VPPGTRRRRRPRRVVRTRSSGNRRTRPLCAGTGSPRGPRRHSRERFVSELPLPRRSASTVILHSPANPRGAAPDRYAYQGRPPVQQAAGGHRQQRAEAEGDFIRTYSPAPLGPGQRRPRWSGPGSVFRSEARGPRTRDTRISSTRCRGHREVLPTEPPGLSRADRLPAIRTWRLPGCSRDQQQRKSELADRHASVIHRRQQIPVRTVRRDEVVPLPELLSSRVVECIDERRLEAGDRRRDDKVLTETNGDNDRPQYRPRQRAVVSSPSRIQVPAQTKASPPRSRTGGQESDGRSEPSGTATPGTDVAGGRSWR